MHVVAEVPQRSILHSDGDCARPLVDDGMGIDICKCRLIGDVDFAFLNLRHDVVLTLITCPLEDLVLFQMVRNA